ncbi:hypothetical protein NDU88_011099 [Pleurodeles waltl]|uniref:Uncharacterized protein n=1 Tax=Pleurodeles waltl TaxID=8319 RepID=A0AAV7QY84_PLEWA|nr:hypothetical protein NDU88_011099 [Pleurodeles waltl]
MHRESWARRVMDSMTNHTQGNAGTRVMGKQQRGMSKEAKGDGSRGKQEWSEEKGREAFGKPQECCAWRIQIDKGRSEHGGKGRKTAGGDRRGASMKTQEGQKQGDIGGAQAKYHRRNTGQVAQERHKRLMTPRPIRSEDGRDVRGRRGGKAEARTKRGVAAGRLLVGLISCGKNKRY